ncbi:MAG: 1-deoxy-D-xylulose-5-phosphate reductoisomerase [bacterium]|jgi:1-deoxy-D-xylulose-5-phosphate reductoisomerase
MKEKLAVLGSTGSIGSQTLSVVESFPDDYEIAALAAGSDIIRLEEQARKYSPPIVAVANPDRGRELAVKLADTATKVIWGEEALCEVAADPLIDTIVLAIVGTAGLIPALAAIRQGKRVCLATKEVLVSAGAIVMAAAAEYDSMLLPVDSEHSAVFQCLQQEDRGEVSKIILTASGGPFYGWDRVALARVTPEQAVRHPNWRMGRKISVDSATLVNKGLEVLEAKWLFGVEIDRIEVVIHPQSIVHSAVEYVDGAVIAQLGITDMRLPIQYALTYPSRRPNMIKRLSLTEIGCLEFARPDLTTFPGLACAYRAGETGGTMPAVFNAANEVAVDKFLNGRIGFTDIVQVITAVMEKHTPDPSPTLASILAADAWARATAAAWRK